MASLGLPFQGTLWYWVEASYGGGASGTTLAVSAKILDAKVSIGDRQKKLRGIDSPNCCKLLPQCKDYAFHVEYIPQVGDTLIEDSILRDATGLLDSLAFCLGANTLQAAADSSYYYVKGCKAKTIRISSNHNTEYTVVIDFDAKSVTTGTAMTGSAPSTPTTVYCAFNIAGSITKDGNPFAYITNSIDITIDNGLNSYFDHDSVDKEFCVEGELNVDGTIDITLDEGGAIHFNEVVALVDFDTVIALGGAGSPEITISNCEWKSSEIDVNISGEAMMESAPFVGKTVSVATV